MKRRVALAVLTVIAAVAVQGFARAAGQPCVTADDVAGGLRVTFVSGRFADYQTEGDGLLRVVESPAKDGRVTTFLSKYGIYDTEMVELRDDQPDPQTLIKTSYTSDNALPVPAAEAIWVGQVTLQRPDGGQTVANAVYQFGTPAKTRLDQCSYDTLDVKVSFMAGDGWLWQEFTYFSDLGIGAIIARQAQADEGPSRAQVKSLEPLTH